MILKEHQTAPRSLSKENQVRRALYRSPLAVIVAARSRTGPPAPRTSPPTYEAQAERENWDSRPGPPRSPQHPSPHHHPTGLPQPQAEHPNSNPVPDTAEATPLKAAPGNRLTEATVFQRTTEARFPRPKTRTIQPALAPSPTPLLPTELESHTPEPSVRVDHCTHDRDIALPGDCKLLYME